MKSVPFLKFSFKFFVLLLYSIKLSKIQLFSDHNIVKYLLNKFFNVCLFVDKNLKRFFFICFKNFNEKNNITNNTNNNKIPVIKKILFYFFLKTITLQIMQITLIHLLIKNNYKKETQEDIQRIY
jgi:hypothetical protein